MMTPPRAKKLPIERHPLPILRIALALLLALSLVPLINRAQGSPGFVQAQAADTANPAPTTTSSTASTNSPATTGDKDEVVYALLESSGAPKTAYVVNHFPVETAGTLTDQGRYDSVENLTTTQQLTVSGDRIQVPVEPGDFYYEGVLNTVELPWLIDIAYTLDGKTVQAAELGGASGQVTIRIQTKRNPRVDARFYDNYLLQVQLTFDTTLVKGISAPDATIASAGKEQQVVFTVLPKRDGDLTLTARVTDFEMQPIQISALPFSMVFDVPDTTALLDDMQTLTDAIAALNSGVATLKSGVADMQGGAARLTSGSTDLNAGLALLKKNSSSLTGASAQIDAALALIAEGVQSEAIDPDEIAQLISGLRQLSAGLSSGDTTQPGLAEGLSALQGGITSATETMDGYIGGLDPVDPASIGALNSELGLLGLTPDSLNTIAQLVSVNTQALYVLGAWYGPSGNDGVKAGLESTVTGLGTSIGTCQYLAGKLTEAADGLEEGQTALADLQVLTGYLQDLSSTYTTFNSGLVAYAGGLDAIAVSYNSFDQGLSTFMNGVTGLYSGVAALHEGSNQLTLNTENLPATLQEEIDSFIDSYRVSDFELTSFVAPGNTHVARVQFVLRIDPIEIPAPAVHDPNDTVPAVSSFWDRLKALF